MFNQQQPTRFFEKESTIVVESLQLSEKPQFFNWIS